MIQKYFRRDGNRAVFYGDVEEAKQVENTLDETQCIMNLQIPNNVGTQTSSKQHVHCPKRQVFREKRVDCKISLGV